jgi:amidase
VSTFITRFSTAGTGVRLAVKDLVDMAGVPTTAGCRAVAERAEPAAADAACLAGARAAGARIVGRANLHELALGVTGINPWYGTPVNPLDPELVPGGSSSGCAVAVATDEADVAYGSDTGGSVRIPSACCGTAGLKTTWGRIPLDGVWPLSPSFDTIGPMARDVTGLITGMTLLEPAFVTGEAAAGDGRRIGRLRVDAHPAIDAAVDAALAATGWEVADVVLPEWDGVTAHAGAMLVAEAWRSDGALLDAHPEGVSADVAARLRLGALIDEAAMATARHAQERWQSRLAALFDEFEALATPTLTIFPPTLARGEDLLMARCTLPVSFAGVPALSVPVPAAGALPASLQLIGPWHAEPALLAAGLVIEAAVAP